MQIMTIEQQNEVLRKLMSKLSRYADNASKEREKAYELNHSEQALYQDGLADGYAGAARWLKFVLANDKFFLDDLDIEDDSK